MPRSKKVALVTGASRGIGKAAARLLAEAGFDVAITARTVREGERREHSSTARRTDSSALPGSLETTAAQVREAGADVLALPADLLDRDSLKMLVETVLQRWGQIDVLVNNGIYVGPGQIDLLLETSIDAFEKHIAGIATAPLFLAQSVLPQMIARGGGVIVNITSAAALRTPDAVAGEGGWGVAYGAGKAALHRIAGFIALEHGKDGVRAFNVQPGFVASERMLHDMAEQGFDFAAMGAPPEVVASVIRWLTVDEAAGAMNGQNIEAQPFCRERNLYPAWSARP